MQLVRRLLYVLVFCISLAVAAVGVVQLCEHRNVTTCMNGVLFTSLGTAAAVQCGQRFRRATSEPLSARDKRSVVFLSLLPLGVGVAVLIAGCLMAFGSTVLGHVLVRGR